VPSHRPRAAASATLAWLALVACGNVATGPIHEPRVRTMLPPLSTGTLAVLGVTVVPMSGPDPRPGQTVVVRDGIIVAIGPASEVEVPPDAERIDGTGRWLMPGLVDMHVHLRRTDLSAYRQAGITTLRSMWGTSEVATLRNELLAGAAHPTIFSAGPGMDGDRPVHPGTVVLTDRAAARQAVRSQAADGWDFIKVYNTLDPAVYAAILDEGHRAGIAVVGHVPFAVSIDGAVELGQASVEHLTGIAESVADGRAPAGWLSFNLLAGTRVSHLLAGRRVWVCPTLTVLEILAGNTLPPASAAQAVSHQGAMVKALHDAGVPLLAGTDGGYGRVPAGSSLARELELMVQAGLTPYEALRTATVNAATFLGLDGQVGTVSVGERADLVLLSANPLADIRAVRTPVGLVQRGSRIY